MFAGCEFRGLIAECPMQVGGVDLTVRAHINHCSTPIDVTFSVQSSSTGSTYLPGNGGLHEEGSAYLRSAKSLPPLPLATPDEPAHLISWQYTFVTSNQRETREVPGFSNEESSKRRPSPHSSRYNLLLRTVSVSEHLDILISVSEIINTKI